MPARDYASTRYSPLDEIDTGNIGRLEVAFTFSTGVDRGQEAAPIVVGSTMYIVTPYPNILYALDLAKPGAPVKWKYEPKPDAGARGGLLRCRQSRRRLWRRPHPLQYARRPHGHGRCEDRQRSLDVKLGEINIGETMTMTPLFARGKVYVGNSGGELGVRGWLQALDAATGKVVWKAWSTGPDEDVLIGPDFRRIASVVVALP